MIEVKATVSVDDIKYIIEDNAELKKSGITGMSDYNTVYWLESCWFLGEISKNGGNMPYTLFYNLMIHICDQIGNFIYIWKYFF